MAEQVVDNYMEREDGDGLTCPFLSCIAVRKDVVANLQSTERTIRPSTEASFLDASEKFVFHGSELAARSIRARLRRGERVLPPSQRPMPRDADD